MINSMFRSCPRIACQVRCVSKKAVKSKSVNQIKTFNSENKLLYGALLETAAERRKNQLSKPYKPVKSDEDSLDYNQIAGAFDDDRPKSSRISKSKETPVSETKQKKEKKKSKETSKKVQENINEEEKLKSPEAPQLIVPPTKITEFPMINVAKQILTVPPSLNLWKIPSVSKVLSATMSESSRAALERWKANLVAQLGLEGFQEHQKGLLLRGSQFHSVIQNHLSGKPIELPPDIEGCWSSVSKVMPDLGKVMNLESPVFHPSLQYRGIIDCIAEFRGEPMLIEWKKSDKRKPMIQYTYDAPLQMTAYIGAMNFDNSYPQKIKQGAVVVAYTDGTPADIFCLSSEECSQYWQFWLDRLQQYWTLHHTQAKNVKV